MTMTKDYGFTPSELRKLRSLDTPAKIQRYLDTLPYHHAQTAWSPRRVLREGTSHCLEAAVFAAAALRVNGHPPLLFDLEAVRDTDHVLALYRIGRGWGTIAKSNFAGLRFRAPAYRSLRELAMSYFDDYFNLRGERTLRAYSRPVDLRRFDRKGWMTAEDSLWYIPDRLMEVPHVRLLTPAMTKRLTRLDERAFRAGLHGYRKH